MHSTFLADLASGELHHLGEESVRQRSRLRTTTTARQVVLAATNTSLGDAAVLISGASGDGERELLSGTPIEQRPPARRLRRTASAPATRRRRRRPAVHLGPVQRPYGLTYLRLDEPSRPAGGDRVVHQGRGRAGRPAATGTRSLHPGLQHRRRILGLRRASSTRPSLTFRVDATPRGRGRAGQRRAGVASLRKASGRYSLSFSTATSPAQIYMSSSRWRGGAARPTSACWAFRTACSRAGEDCLVHHATTGCASRRGSICRRRSLGFTGQRPAGLLHPRRPAEPGAARLHLVLHAAHPVPDAQRLCRLGAQRARQQRLRSQLHEARRSRLGRPGPARPRGADRAAAPGHRSST